MTGKVAKTAVHKRAKCEYEWAVANSKRELALARAASDDRLFWALPRDAEGSIEGLEGFKEGIVSSIVAVVVAHADKV